VRIAYLVSRFPAVSETFVLRELNAVDRHADVEVDLLSLFPSRDSTVHPSARGWLDDLTRPGAIEVGAGLGFWLLRRPLRLLGSIGIVAAASIGHPRVLIRSMVALGVAAAHARIVERRRVEHVHAHFATYPALAAWLCMRLAGSTYSFTAHAHDIFVHQVMLERKIADAEFVVAISEYNRDFLHGFNSADTPLEVVHCGIEPALYPFRKRELPGGSGLVRLLCVAGLRESKGHTILLEAIASGGESFSPIRLDLAGDGPLREELIAMSERLGLGERVRFLGSQTEEAVRRLLDEADLFALPSVIASDGDMEGIPVALMEAMASGLLTIASRMSGIPELVRDGETGLLVEPGDRSDLGAALARALAGGSSVSQEAARRLVEDEFDVARSGTRMYELFTAGATA
jgi:glycosyltransferase involved in cell wall biosynthesis